MSIPVHAPSSTPLKFVTMTMGNSLDRFINLWVLAKHYKLDVNARNAIVGIKFEDVIRGKIKPKKIKKKNNNDTKSKRFTDFKHQCTLIINCLDKDINVKLFNNGRMVCTGCNNIKQAHAAAQIISDALFNLQGEITYGIPYKFESMNLKKTHKQDIIVFTSAIEMISHELGMNLDLELFNPSISKADSFLLFKNNLETDDKFEQDLCYIITLLTILKTYYGKEFVKDAESLSEFGELFDMLIEHTNMDDATITMPFLSYLDNDKPIIVKSENVRINMINHTMSCEYNLNRVRLGEILDKDPSIKFINYNKNSYTGLNAYYKCNVDCVPGKKNTIAVIFFGSGKINITAAKSFKQSEEVYEYISNLCRDNFDKLLMKSAYRTKERINNNGMPDTFDMGMSEEGYKYLLIKKSAILRNPRSVNLLKNTFGLLEKYK